jgi:hypothetical protein
MPKLPKNKMMFHGEDAAIAVEFEVLPIEGEKLISERTTMAMTSVQCIRYRCDSPQVKES